MTISVAAGCDKRLGIGGAVGDVRALRGQRHHKPPLPQILHGPPHGTHGYARLLGHLPLTLQAGARQQLAALDATRDPVRDLLPRVHGPGRVDDRLLITHEWNVESPTAPRLRR